MFQGLARRAQEVQHQRRLEDVRHVYLLWRYRRVEWNARFESEADLDVFLIQCDRAVSELRRDALAPVPKAERVGSETGLHVETYRELLHEDRTITISC